MSFASMDVNILYVPAFVFPWLHEEQGLAPKRRLFCRRDIRQQSRQMSTFKTCEVVFVHAPTSHFLFTVNWYGSFFIQKKIIGRDWRANKPVNQSQNHAFKKMWFETHIAFHNITKKAMFYRVAVGISK